MRTNDLLAALLALSCLSACDPGEAPPDAALERDAASIDAHEGVDAHEALDAHEVVDAHEALEDASVARDDAAAPTTDAATVPVDAAGGADASSAIDARLAGPSPVELAITVHLENGTFDEAWWRTFEDHAARFEAHGAFLTLEPREVTLTADARRASPSLPRLRARGHEVGLHAAVGASSGATYDAFVRDLVRQRSALEALVGPIEHVSGTCAAFDWAGGVAEAGFSFTTAATVYCLMPVPAAERPAEYRATVCRSPFDPVVCHDPYPQAIDETAHAWRVASGATWLREDDAGRLVVLPGRGTIDCSVEEMGSGAAGTCVLRDDDVAIALAELDETIAMRDPTRPAQLYWVWSYGRSLDFDVLERLLVAVDERVARGEARWATANQIHASFVAWEATRP